MRLVKKLQNKKLSSFLFCTFCIISFIIFLYLRDSNLFNLLLLNLQREILPAPQFLYEIVPFRTLYRELSGAQTGYFILRNLKKIALATVFNSLLNIFFSSKKKIIIFSLLFYVIAEITVYLTRNPFSYFLNIDNFIYFILGLIISILINKKVRDKIIKHERGEICNSEMLKKNGMTLSFKETAAVTSDGRRKEKRKKKTENRK